MKALGSPLHQCPSMFLVGDNAVRLSARGRCDPAVSLARRGHGTGHSLHRFALSLDSKRVVLAHPKGVRPRTRTGRRIPGHAVHGASVLNGYNTRRIEPPKRSKIGVEFSASAGALRCLYFNLLAHSTGHGVLVMRKHNASDLLAQLFVLPLAVNRAVKPKKNASPSRISDSERRGLMVETGEN